MAGDAPSRRPVPAVPCYGGFVTYGYDDEYSRGRDAGSPPVRHGRCAPYQYVYDEEDNNDYKVFPPPAPGALIESTGHGYTIVPMTPDGEGLFAGVSEQQQKTPVAAALANKDGSDRIVGANKDGGVAAALGGGCVGVEADHKEDLEDMLYYEFYYHADDNLAEPGTTTVMNLKKTLQSAWVSTGIVAT